MSETGKKVIHPFKYLPVQKCLQPGPEEGLWRHYVNRYWIQHPEKGLAFYDIEGEPDKHNYNYPQCNVHGGVMKLTTPKEFQVVFHPSVWVRHFEEKGGN